MTTLTTAREKELHQAYKLGLECYERSGDLFDGNPYRDDFEAMKAFSRGLNEGRRRERQYWNRDW